MITFKQFISEQEIKAVRDILLKDCRPFLMETKGNGFLVRGVKGLSTAKSYSALDYAGEEMEYTEKQVRKDRRPLDISQNRSDIIDDWFQDKFGIRARTQCVFAGGEKMRSDELKHYGTPCIIFPIGEIKYVWSPNVEDIYGDMNLHSPGEGEIEGDEDLKARINKWLDSKHYKTTDLQELIQTGKEVMVECDSYYAFPIEYKHQLKLSLGIL